MFIMSEADSRGRFLTQAQGAINSRKNYNS